MGFLGVFLPSFGIDPAAGSDQFTFAAWKQLFHSAEFWSGLSLSLFIGVVSTALSYWIATSLVIACFGSHWFDRLTTFIAPILSIPHVAISIGLIFLISPSGWLVRWFSPWLTGFERPPNWLIVQDPQGWSMILALVIKETPYLVFAIMAALSQLDARSRIQTAKILGHSTISAWHGTLLGPLYRLVRLPVMIVLAFSMTVVDVALIIGPNTPSTLAVTLLRWFNDPSLMLRGQASAAAIVLACGVVVMMLLWEACYFIYDMLRKYVTLSGNGITNVGPLTWFGALVGSGIFLLTALTLMVLPIWAFAHRWRFPDTWPSQFSFNTISRLGQRLLELSMSSLSLALVSGFLALLVSLVLLERERRFLRSKLVTTMMLFTVLMPQITLLFGIQVGLLWVGWNGNWWSVLLLHLIYVLPYVYLTLKAPYLAFDERILQQANLLKDSPIKNYLLIKLPLLKVSLSAAFALGFAVSMAQYLPTIMSGEGRINTLTTEAVARASSGDRKIVSSLALIQAFLPLICFYLATVMPKHWTTWRVALRRKFC